MTDEQKAALEWLRGVGEDIKAWGLTEDGTKHHVPVIEAMLAQPRLPKGPIGEAVDRVIDIAERHSVPLDLVRGFLTTYHAALYAHQTKPKTKTVEVWHVEYAWQGLRGEWCPMVSTYETEGEARATAQAHSTNGSWRFTHVTGPHKQEVPA